MTSSTADATTNGPETTDPESAALERQRQRELEQAKLYYSLGNKQAGDVRG